MSASSAIAVFNELGNALERRWQRAGYDIRAFPGLAVDALAAADLARLVPPTDILRWILSTAVVPPQNDLDGEFGDLPITIFKGSRFIVDAYYWLDGTTSIHQHAFAGGFQVLAGGSVHSRYRFDERHIVNEHFAVGDLALEEVELLALGDIRPILPGRQYIHSLFHLNRPSISIVIRTQSPAGATQYDYYRPHLAVDSFYRNPELIKKVRGVAVLFATNDPDADAIVGDAVASADFQTTYSMLAEAYRRLKPGKLEALFERSHGSDRFRALLERARPAHGELVDAILPVLQERDRQTDVFRRRRAITGEAHRFLLALLLNVHEKEHVLALVRQRVPDRDPVDVVAEWVDELAHVKIFGSTDPNVLGIKAFGPDHRRALEHVLRDREEPGDVSYRQQLDASILGTLTGRAARHVAK
jgi:hypothetical protein